jgi:ergothioneine biosynthesis protein EgtB
MDIKHVLSINPLCPAYRPTDDVGSRPARPLGWVDVDAGIIEVGATGDGFCFDNELPRHTTHTYPFALADRLVTAGEWAEFIADGGYRRPDLWLSDGWYAVEREGWTAPLYWMREGEGWHVHTLAGTRPIVDAEPVAHVSYYEADAYARWAGVRLPTEAEWETAAGATPVTGNLLETDALHPRPAAVSAAGATGPLQPFGDVWEWTRSAYSPYPGYRPPAGALGEYNGKFMSGQMVLRGGSCVTPQDHIRKTYRNFFAPGARWQFTGIRLAADGPR